MSSVEEIWDAELIASVANHPDVYPWICGDRTEPFDYTEHVKNRNHIFLFGKWGGIHVLNMDGAIFDAHPMILPQGRGFWAQAAGEEALKFLFTKTCAKEVTASVPKGNIPAMAFARRLGLTFRGTIEDGYQLRGKMVPLLVHSITKDEYKCLQH